MKINLKNSIILFLSISFSLSAFSSCNKDNEETHTKRNKDFFLSINSDQQVLTVGEHGTFKGFEGLQKALNVVQDQAEIKIERGIIIGSGLVISEEKAWKHGITISGGWNENFDLKSNNSKETILDGGGGKNRILSIFNSEGKVAIENLTFRNSKGGAVRIINYGSVVFTNCNFIGNSAMSGGAVSGGGTFIDCAFINNTARDNKGSTYGGAVSGGGTFTNCIFKDNRAIDSKGSSYGGAVTIEATGRGDFSNCTFTNNKALQSGIFGGSHGGAVAVGDGAIITCTRCVFTNNKALKEGILGNSVGGAVSIFPGGGGGTFTNCTFTNNTAMKKGIFGSSYGGAISGGGTFTNCTFTNNFAKVGGAFEGKGAFTNSVFKNNSAEVGGAVSGEGRFTNCTFYGNNSKRKGGAIFVSWVDKVKIMNSIFYKNSIYGENNDITSENGNNIVIDYSLINYLNGHVIYGENNIMGTPKFVDPEKEDFHLLPDSPCINSGKIVSALKNYPSDLDGKPRIAGGNIDMGAYEWQ